MFYNYFIFTNVFIVKTKKNISKIPPIVPKINIDMYCTIFIQLLRLSCTLLLLNTDFSRSNLVLSLLSVTNFISNIITNTVNTINEMVNEM